MDPYRDAPETPTTPTRERDTTYRARLLRAGLAVGLAALALPIVARTCRTRTAPGVPSELLDAGARFPAVPADLPQAAPLEPLLVADAPDRLAVLSPSSTAQNLRPGEPLVVRFNRPMVPGSAVGKPVDDSPLRFSETTRGRTTWTSRSALSFEPERSTWSRTHEAAVSLSPGLRSLAGEALEGALEHTVVFDDGPRLQGSASGRRIVAGEPVALWFTGKVDPGALGSALMAYEVDGGRRMLPFSIATRPRDERGRTRVDLTLRTKLEPGAKLAVAVAPPLAGGGSSPDVVGIELAPRPHVEGIDCPEDATDAASCTYTEPPGKIVDIGEALRLVSSVPLETPEPSAITVSPPLDELRVEVEAEKRLVVRGAFAPGQVYEVRFEGLRDDDGNALARTPPLAVRSAGRKPEVRIPRGFLTFERDAAPIVPIAGIHVDTGEARILAVPSDHELEALIGMAHDEGVAKLPLATLLPAARANRWSTKDLDWAALVPGGGGMARIALLADEGAKTASNPAATFVQRTDLGIDAKVFPRGVLTWVTSIASAKPIAGAQVTIADAQANPIGLVTTDDAGVAWLPVLEATKLEHAVTIRATRGDDRAVMMVDPTGAMTPRHFGTAPGARAEDAPSVVGSLFTDRGIVRPGESVQAKAILRKTEGGGLAAASGEIELALFDESSAAPVQTRVVKATEAGSASASFLLDASAAPGTYRVEAKVPGDERAAGRARFTVGDYRPPTFRVDLDAPRDVLIEREELRVEVAAKYMFGPPAARRSARFTITRQGGDDPEGWDDYTFTPVDAEVSTATMAAGDLELDEAGRAVVTAPVAIGASARGRASVEVTVSDVSGLTTTATKELTLRPAGFEIGVHAGPAWMDSGATLDVEAVVVTGDGKASAGRPVEARIVREGWHRYWEWAGGAGGDDDGEDGGDGVFQQRRAHRAEVVHECKATSGAAPVHCAWKAERPGTYVLEASTEDDAGRIALASRRVYVAGPDEHPDRDRPGARIDLTPKSASSRVGETAEIAFESPFPDAEALLEVHQGALLFHERRRVGPGGHVFRVPVTAQMVPTAYASLTLVRPRTGPPGDKIDLDAPDLRVALAELTVRPDVSPLAVAIEAPPRAGAGSDAPVAIAVTDEAGRGVEAEVALWAVDEGTLRVTGYEIPSADAGFFPRIAPSFAWEDLRRVLVSRVTAPLLPSAGGDGGGAPPPRPIEQLERFEPTPLWLPHVTTDSSGRASAVLHLPERGTSYRIMAVATDAGIRTGKAETTLLATMPVVVRPVTPTIATVGDRFEAVAFVHNTEKEPVEIAVTPTVDGVARPSRMVRVAAESEARVSEWIDVSHPGALSLGWKATAPGSEAEVLSSLRVAPRARVVRSSAVGAVKESRTITLEVAKDDVDATTLAIATNPFVGFDTAVDSLLASGEAGVEATASSLVGLVAYAALDTGKRPGSLGDDDVRAHGDALVARLTALQTPSGGFGAFTATDPPDGYSTAFALHALSRASRAGFTVRDDVRIRARVHLAERVRGGGFLDGTEGGGTGHDELAFALRVLSEEAEPDLERMSALFQQRERLGPYGLSQLILAMSDDDFRRVTLAADALRVLFTRDDEVKKPSVLRWYDGSARTLGAVLEAASSVEAVAEATPLLAARVLLARSPETAGWRSSHETSHALAGLAAYAKLFPAGDSLDAKVTVDGALVTASETRDDLAWYAFSAGSLAPGSHEVRIEVAGAAWFAIDGSSVVPLGEADEVARGAAAALHRRFEDESGKPLPSGSHVKLGDLVRVRLFLFAEQETPPYVVVRDRLAGGLEPVDGTLATSPRDSLGALLGMGPDDEVVDARAHYATRSLDLISHRTLAPGAAAFYLAHPGAGLHELTYGVRATTPGTFLLAPAEATALYARDFVARSAMATLVVDP